ncbi:MAG TPA: Lsm family RNA-binding protein [Conexivisphaerales archaeon]|nr:Lsm family RNA-binding protein [Conexivisphaerales archaeon]
MSVAPARRYIEELGTFVGRKVQVETSDGRKYDGLLLGISENLSLVLGGYEGGMFKVAINGSQIREVRLVEKPFDLKTLAEAINKVFPGLVRLREDIGAIIVMDKIKVTESGVVEGTGPSADRVRQVYDGYLATLKKTEKQA